MEAPIEFNEWLYQRLGRFTASEIWKLFVSGRRDMTAAEMATEKSNGGKRKTIDTLFGDTALTYIMTKAAERLTMSVKPESNFIQTNHGKEHEWDAKEAFIEKTGLQGEYFGTFNPKFFPEGEYFGVSPDFLGDDFAADFKCPYDSAVHLSNLMLDGQIDFRDKRWEYYCQAQMIMLQLNLTTFYYVSYDKRYIEPELQLKVLRIGRDAEWINEFEVRSVAAVEELNKIISQLN